MGSEMCIRDSKLEVELSGPLAAAAAPRRLAPSALLSSAPRAAAAGDADAERSSGFFLRRRFGRTIAGAAAVLSFEFRRPVTKSRSDAVIELSLLRRLRPLHGHGPSCCCEGAGEGLALMLPLTALLRPLVVVLAAAMVWELGGVDAIAGWVGLVCRSARCSRPLVLAVVGPGSTPQPPSILWRGSDSKLCFRRVNSLFFLPCVSVDAWR